MQAGVAAHLAEPADTAVLRGKKKRAKTDRADARLERELLADGRLPECWVSPTYILACRALLETYHELREQHTGWLQRIHAVLYHHGIAKPAHALVSRDTRRWLARVALPDLHGAGDNTPPGARGRAAGEGGRAERRGRRAA